MMIIRGSDKFFVVFTLRRFESYLSIMCHTSMRSNFAYFAQFLLVVPTACVKSTKSVLPLLVYFPNFKVIGFTHSWFLCFQHSFFVSLVLCHPVAVYVCVTLMDVSMLFIHTNSMIIFCCIDSAPRAIGLGREKKEIERITQQFVHNKKWSNKQQCIGL